MHLSYLLIDTDPDPARPRPGRAWVRNVYRVHQRLCMAFPCAGRKERERRENVIDRFIPEEFRTLVAKESEAGGRRHVHYARGTDAGFLFRIDLVGAPVRAAGPQAAEWRRGLGEAPPSRHVITVQSATPPDWEYAFQHAREFLCAAPLVKDYAPAFEAGQRYRFVLRANPTKKLRLVSRAELRAAREANVVLAGRNGRREFLADPAGQEQWLRTQAEGGAGRRDKGFRVLSVCAEAESPARGGRGRGDESIVLAAVRFEGVLEVVAPDAFRDTVVAGIGPGKGFGFGLLSVAPA